MKNVVYAGIIGACILVAVIVFMKTHGGPSGVDTIGDTEMTWVKCVQCGKGYEMPLKQYFTEVAEKTKASTASVPGSLPTTCKLCGKDGIFRGYKCEKCGEIFRAGSVLGDIEDRCPKCKHSAREAKAAANRAKTGQ